MPRQPWLPQETRQAVERSFTLPIPWSMKSGRLSAQNTLRLGQLGLSSGRLAASRPFRSAAPLAAAGIICLGLVPTLGGPERPLHWAVTAGMVGFGVLLWARRRQRGAEGPLELVAAAAARKAGRTLLLVAGVIALLVSVIIAFRLHDHAALSGLSLALPAAALIWLGVLGLQTLLHRPPPSEATNSGERPSRRPPQWDAFATQNRPSSPPDRHANA